MISDLCIFLNLLASVSISDHQWFNCRDWFDEPVPWPLAKAGMEPRRWRSLCVSPKGSEDFRIVLPLELF
jgi:hypothetical protein